MKQTKLNILAIASFIGVSSVSQGALITGVTGDAGTFRTFSSYSSPNSTNTDRPRASGLT